MFFIKRKKEKELNNKINFLIKQLDNINQSMLKSNMYEIISILGSKKEIMKRNIIAGIFRGVGIGIGITVITAIIVIILQKVVTLNIPIIGEYISDIVDIVQNSK